MPMDLTKFRKLVALDQSDALSRFALGQALFQQGHSPETLSEAVEHLTFANPTSAVWLWITFFGGVGVV